MTVFFSRLIGPIPVEVVLREGHRSSLGITENAVESGAKITDHAYIEPKVLKLDFADQGGALVYNALVRLQETRVPFVIVSGLYVYKDMLIKELHAERDQYTGRILKGECILQQVILVSTSKTAGTGDKKDGQQDTKNADDDKKSDTTERGDQVAVTPRDQSVLHSWGIGPGNQTAPQSGQGPRGDT